MLLGSFAFVVNKFGLYLQMKTFKDKNILKAKTKIKISNKFQLTIFF